MATYCTAQEFIDIFGPSEALMLTQLDDPLATEINLDLLERSLEQCSEECNGYFRSRYPVPVPKNDMVRRKVADMARWYLCKYEVNDVVRNGYRDAVNWLRAVSSGRAVLGIAEESGETIQTSSGALIGRNHGGFRDIEEY